MIKKVIVAHPGKQHSFRTASALKKSDMLCRYVTTVYNSKKSWLMKLLKRVMPDREKQRIEMRINPDLVENDIVQYCVMGGYIEIFLSRIRRLSSVYLIWQQMNASLFGRKVAKLAMKEKAAGVIMYDTNAKKCFELLKKKDPSIKRIVDATHINRVFQEEQIFGSKPDEYENERCKYRFPTWFLKRIEKENEATDIFLVPSGFVKKSLIYSGIPEEKIAIVPYGSNFENLEYVNREHRDGKLVFIFVGKVSYAKGVSYLLEAFSRVDPELAELRLVGTVDKNGDIYRKYHNLKNVLFKGSVLHNEVLLELKASDVFILPSLMEGMSLAGLEAMSCGLPILCTKNSGLDQFITENNGFIVDAMDANQIYEKIEWFIRNRDRIPAMSKCAFDAAQLCTWANYEKRLVEVLADIV